MPISTTGVGIGGQIWRGGHRSSTLASSFFLRKGILMPTEKMASRWKGRAKPASSRTPSASPRPMPKTQLEQAEQLEVALEAGRLEAEPRVAFGPGLEPQAERSEFPGVLVAEPGPESELASVEHEVGVGFEKAAEEGADPQLARLVATQVEVPGGGVVEGVESLGGGVDGDQPAVLGVFVGGVEADQHAAGPAVEDRQRAELAFGVAVGPLAEDRGGALEKDDRPGHDDGEQEFAVEGVAVVGKGAEGDAGAQGEAALAGGPFVPEVGDAGLAAVVEAFAVVEAEPLLRRRLSGSIWRASRPAKP